MRAAVLRGGSVEVRIIGDPVPGPGQLLVRSLACGICASDLHFMDHPEAGSSNPAGGSPLGALSRRDAVLAMSRGASASSQDKARH